MAILKEGRADFPERESGAGQLTLEKLLGVVLGGVQVDSGIRRKIPQ